MVLTILSRSVSHSHALFATSDAVVALCLLTRHTPTLRCYSLISRGTQSYPGLDAHSEGFNIQL